MEGGQCAQMAKNYKRNFQYAHFRSFPQKVNDKFIQKHFKKLIAPISHINWNMILHKNLAVNDQQLPDT